MTSNINHFVPYVIIYFITFLCTKITYMYYFIFILPWINGGFHFFMIYFGVKFLYCTPWNLISDLDFYEVISNFMNLYVDCYYYAITNCKSCKCKKMTKFFHTSLKKKIFVLPFSPVFICFLVLVAFIKIEFARRKKMCTMPA